MSVAGALRRFENRHALISAAGSGLGLGVALRLAREGVDTTREVLPHMRAAGYGRVINLGSKAGRYGSLFAGANYTAAKGAMQAFTMQIAQEFGPDGITCNTVCPGAILTARVQRLLAERQTPEERRRNEQSIPVRRHGRVEDVAAAIAYLASEEAGFVTGASLDVNGGQAMAI